MRDCDDEGVHVQVISPVPVMFRFVGSFMLFFSFPLFLGRCLLVLLCTSWC
jgi:hypothetical protein